MAEHFFVTVDLEDRPEALKAFLLNIVDTTQAQREKFAYMGNQCDAILDIIKNKQP